MALPLSGQIGFNDLNDALLRTTTNQLSMSDAADNLGVSYNTAGTDQLGMDEFYGKTYTGFAYTMSVSPTQSSVIASGETKTYTYTSDGAFGIVSYPSWSTPSIQSGSAGTNLTFTVAYDSQALDAALRTGTITLQSPLAVSKYIYVTQSANPATLTITNNITYDYRGGSDLYYTIDTSPESQITWTASLDTYVGFGHRKGASGAFSNTSLNGTGDTNIYVSASSNSSTSTDRVATATADPINITDPNVTATITVLKKPDLTYQIDVGGGNYQNITTLNFTYDAYGIANAKTVRFSTNQSANSATPTITGGNSTKFSLEDQGVVGGYRVYKFYPTEFNASGGTYTTTARITFLDLNFDLTLNQTSAPAPTVAISPSSYNWTYTDTSNVLFTATVTTYGNAATSLNFSLNSAYFKLVDYSGTNSDDGAIVVSNPNGNVWVGSSSSPGSYTIFKVYARPVGNNYTAGSYSTTLTVTVGNTTGNGSATATLSQTGAPAFTSADWNGTISITSLGSVSVTNGNSTTTVSYTPTSFGTVTSDTSRTITISNVTVPSGYSNAGSVLAAFDRTATQPAAPRTLTLSADTDATHETIGQDTSVTLTIDDVYYTDTSWTLTTDTYGGYPQLGSVGFAPSSTGNGDGTRYLTFTENTSGVDRANRIYLNGTSGPTTYVIQHSYTPAPSFSSYSTPSDWLYYEYNASQYYKVASFTVSGVHTGASFTLNSPYFKFVDYSSNAADDGGISVSNPNGNVWVGSASYTSYTTYKVYVVPQQQNNSSANYTTTLTMTISYSGGSVQQTATLTQLWNPSLSASPSSLSFVATSPSSQTVSVTSNIAWTATVSGTGFEISGDNSTFGTSAVGKTGNDSVYVKPTTNGGGSRTGTLSIAGNAPYSSTTTSVSLSQAAAVSNYYYQMDLYDCVNGGCQYSETIVGVSTVSGLRVNRWYLTDCGYGMITGTDTGPASCTIDTSTFWSYCPACL
jgi:hypothetical protein